MTSQKTHCFQNKQKFSFLDCKKAFNHLTNQEKLYAHYLSRASYEGILIAYIQCSPEAPLIFTLLHRILLGEPMEMLKSKCMVNDIATHDYTVRLCATLATL